jgi:hypothetical protein
LLLQDVVAGLRGSKKKPSLVLDQQHLSLLRIRQIALAAPFGLVLILFRRHRRVAQRPEMRRSISRTVPTKKLSDAAANSRAL